MRNLIVCPIYNEEKYISTLIDQIRSVCDFPILIINDGSSDNTLDLIKQRDIDYLINHNKKNGYGKSLLDGFEFAILNDFESLVTIDGDLQHDATMIPLLFNKLIENDVVLGSRYLYIKNHPNIIPPRTHYIYHKLIGDIINHTFDTSLTDIFCGYRAYSVDKLKLLNLDIEGYGLSIQIVVQLLNKNLNYEEIPVPMIYHRPIRERLPIKEKNKYYPYILKNELEKIGKYDENIFRALTLGEIWSNPEIMNMVGPSSGKCLSD